MTHLCFPKLAKSLFLDVERGGFSEINNLAFILRDVVNQHYPSTATVEPQNQ